MAAEAPTKRRTSSRYFPGLDGFRGLAALLVLVFHVAAATGVNAEEGFAAHVTRPLGALGVSIFFVLSGFLLYRPFAWAHIHAQPAPHLGAYFRRRALRLFPAYWLALTVYAFIAHYPRANIENFRDVVLYYGLQQGYVQGEVLAGVPVAWTLTVELSFYLFLPFFALAAPLLAGSNASPWERFLIQLVTIVALFVLSSTVRLVLLQSGAGLTGVFPALADWFAVGMGLAVCTVWFDGRRLPGYLRAFAHRPSLGLVIALVLFFLVVRMRLPGNFMPLSTTQHMTRNLLFGLIGLALIAPLALGPDETSPLRRVLESPIPRWTGMVSYGIYLWHMLVLRYVDDWIDAVGFTPTFWSTLIATAMASIAIASASWIALERPIVRLGRSSSPNVITTPVALPEGVVP